LVGVTGATVLGSEGIGQPIDPTIEEALDMGGGEAGAEALQGSWVIAMGDAVVER